MRARLEECCTRCPPPSSQPSGGTIRRPGIRAWLVAAAVVAAGVLAALTWYGRDAGPDQLWRRAHEAIQASQWDRAEAELARLGRARSPTPEDWMLRAQLAMARGRVDAALADLAKIPDAHELAPQARLRAGQLELRRNRLRAAEEAFLAASRLDPNLVQARRELIYIYGMQGRRAELDAQFRALAKLTPLTFDNALHWGLMSHESWQPDQVTDRAGTIRGGRPDRSLVATGLGREPPADRARRRRVEGARAPARLGPRGPGAPGAAGAGPGRPRDRRGAAGRGPARPRGPGAAQGTPGAGEARRPLGLAPFRRGGRRRAGESRRHAGPGPGVDPDRRRGEGEALPRGGPAPRRDVLAPATAQVPEGHHDVELFRKLGEACASDGRQDEARAWLALALAHDPLDAEAQRALFRLRAGSDRVETQATTAGPSAVTPP